VVGDEKLDTPERASEQAKLMVTGTLFHPFMLGWTDLELVTVGGVRSMLMLVSVVLAALSARSVQFPVTDWPLPSPRVVGDEKLDTPERASEQAKLMVTGTLFHPFMLG